MDTHFSPSQEILIDLWEQSDVESTTVMVSLAVFHKAKKRGLIYKDYVLDPTPYKLP
jgi:hypothetical protein